MERMLIEYLLNSVWQAPLLAAAAWLLLRIVRAGPLSQHRVWLMVLAVSIVLPMHGIGRTAAPGIAEMVASPAISIAPAPVVTPERSELRPRGERWRCLLVGRQWVHLSARSMQWLLWLYLMVLVFGGFRFVWAWRTAWRLAEDAGEVKLDGKVLEALAGCVRRFRIERPELRESSRVLSPVTVGVWKPILILPLNFMLHTGEEIEATLFHELAHVQRRDTLMNLLCSLMGLPLLWNPAIHAVERRIRSTREMVCDAMAAREMRSSIGYARCLLSLAQSMVGARQTQALGLFENNRMEERVMCLMKTRVEVRMPARIAHLAGGGAVMLAAIAIAAGFHITPALAQTQPAPVIQPAPAAPAATSPATPTAIAHGSNARVLPEKGEYIHRWTGMDGKPFVISNRERQEPTPEERRRIEQEFKQKMARMKIDMAGINLSDVQRQVKDATAQIDSSEFKQQMAQMQQEIRNAQQAELSASVLADMQRQIKNATAQIDSPEFKQQMAQLQQRLQKSQLQRSVDMTRLQSELQRLNIPQIQRGARDAAAQMNSRELEQEMANVQRAVRNGELQRDKAVQILKDAERQLEHP